MTYYFCAGHVSVTADQHLGLEMADPRAQDYLADVADDAISSQFAGSLVARLELKHWGWHLALNGTTIEGQGADCENSIGYPSVQYYGVWWQWSPNELYIESASAIAPLTSPLLHEDSHDHLIEMLDGLLDRISDEVDEADKEFRALGWDSPSYWVVENLPTAGELCAALHYANDYYPDGGQSALAATDHKYLCSAPEGE